MTDIYSSVMPLDNFSEMFIDPSRVFMSKRERDAWEKSRVCPRANVTRGVNACDVFNFLTVLEVVLLGVIERGIFLSKNLF